VRSVKMMRVSLELVLLGWKYDGEAENVKVIL
jgi:hypothetical protein